MRYDCAMCRFSDAELNCVSTKMRRMSACRQLLIGISISRYLPPIGTAGFERCCVNGNRREPWPPPRMSASTSLFTAMVAANGTPRPACNGRVNGICYNFPGFGSVSGASGGASVAFFRLIPREEKFYSDFLALADELMRGSRMLEEMLAADRPVWDKADEIKEVEHKCDFLTHEIIQRLHRTFVTPLDREDIHELARSLDDVMDAIDATAALVRLYQISLVRTEARELTR